MINKKQSTKANNLTNLLKRINHGDDPEMLRREAHRLLTNVDPADIAAAEQNLINDGYSAQLVQLLSATFMLIAMPQQQCDDILASLPENHLVRVINAEHNFFKFLIEDLNDITKDITTLQSLTDTACQFRRLAHITEHISAMKEHLEREDDVIFPFLIKHGRISLCLAMKGDHVSIKNEINKLVTLVMSFNAICFDDFKKRLNKITEGLLPIVREHLSQEDAILYPIALGVIQDALIWKKMKAVCDEIGYCGIHL
jgi:DUF438 domain-containing protein